MTEHGPGCRFNCNFSKDLYVPPGGACVPLVAFAPQFGNYWYRVFEDRNQHGTAWTTDEHAGKTILLKIWQMTS